MCSVGKLAADLHTLCSATVFFIVRVGLCKGSKIMPTLYKMLTIQHSVSHSFTVSAQCKTLMLACMQTLNVLYSQPHFIPADSTQK